MYRWPIYIFVLGFLSLAACATDDPEGKGVSSTCTIDDDCDPGLYCGAGNKCAQDCDPSDSEGDACEAGFSCNEYGRCVATGECTTNGDCDSPPDAITCDGNVVVGYSTTGVCETDNVGETFCNYPEARTPCEVGCREGACIGDPCDGAVCNTPPAAVCEGDVRVSFGAAGVCVDGDCNYTEQRDQCAGGCTAGVCNDSACENVMCNSAPASRCDDTVAITYEAAGTCDDSTGAAVCTYPIGFEDCRYTGAECSNATCINPLTQAGGVVIVEYMADPVGSFIDENEWFEIVNVSGAAVDLTGWRITSGGAMGIDEATTIVDNAQTSVPAFPDGGRLLFARVADAAGSATVDYIYSDISMANGGDWLALEDDQGNVVDYIYYEAGSLMDGRSRKLNPALTATTVINDDFTNWCPSLSDSDAFTTSPENYGTPGAANTQCAVNPCTDWTCEKPADFCVAIDKAVQFAAATAMCEPTRLNNPRCDFQPTEVDCQAAELCALGACEGVPANVPAAGEVIFTEIMGNPDGTDSNREWFELYNTTASDKSLFSLVFQDNEAGGSNDSFTILDINATIPAMSWVVYARNADNALNGGVNGAFEYSGGHLKNTPAAGFELSLVRQDGVVVDVPAYGPCTPTSCSAPDGSQIPNGQSIQRDPNSGSWCSPDTLPSYGAGGQGTPGAINATCGN